MGDMGAFWAGGFGGRPSSLPLKRTQWEEEGKEAKQVLSVPGVAPYDDDEAVTQDCRTPLGDRGGGGGERGGGEGGG